MSEGSQLIGKFFLDEWEREFNDDHTLIRTTRPLFAHYTSISAFESIIKSQEIWFSNPVYMNDLHELLHGTNLGVNVFHERIIDTCNCNTTKTRLSRFLNDHIEDINANLCNIYIFCITQHMISQNDGLLSMWRGYGGNGSGVAIVFNSKFINLDVDTDVQLPVIKVKYLSEDEYKSKIANLVDRWADLFKSFDNDDGDLRYAVQILICLFISLSLSTKHPGFAEEQEWRLIYLPQFDSNNLFMKNMSYSIHSDQIQPRLKFPVRPLPGDQTSNWTFSDIVENIIIGPTARGPLIKQTIVRMLKNLDRDNLASKVIVSNIPLRSS